jgi:hypothetical protein
MNYREKYTGNKEEFYFFLKDEVIKLFKDNLKIEGNLITIPDDEELDFQIKIDSDEHYGDFTIKVKWGDRPAQTDELEENSTDKFNHEPFEF